MVGQTFAFFKITSHLQKLKMYIAFLHSWRFSSITQIYSLPTYHVYLRYREDGLKVI